MRPSFCPKSIISPSTLIPFPYKIWNSAFVNGGETLFFTTFTLVSFPMTSSPSFTAPILRISNLTDE